MKSLKKIAAYFSILLSLVLLFMIAKNIDINLYYQQLTSIKLNYLFIILIFSLLIIPFMTFRYLGILKTINPTSSFSYILNIILKSNIANMFLPGKTGDLIKGYMLKKHFPLSHAYIATFLERVIDLFILGLICIFFSHLINYSLGITVGYVLVISIILFISTSLLFYGKLSKYKKLKTINRIYSDYYRIIINFLTSPKHLTQTLISSLSVWCINIFVVIVTYHAIASSSLSLSVIAVFPLAIIFGALPISFNGIGTRDAALAFFLKDQLTLEQIFTISTIYTLVTYFWISLVGALLLLINKYAIKKS